MRVAIYSRFSTDRQTESSIADQVRVCTEFAKREGWTIAAKFEDQGISGAALGNRPGVLAMRDAAKAGRFDVLVMMDISRLSRSMGDVAKLTEQLVFSGIRVVAVHDNADTAREGWEMQFGLAGLIGQHFRKMVSMKTRTALESRAKTQRPTGGKAYGYVGGNVDSAQAKVVREIFTRFAEGESCRKVAEALNAKAVPSPGSSWQRTQRRAAGWMGSGVRAMLMNEKYRGRIIWGASTWRKDPDSGMRRRIEKPKAEWITHTDEALRIVSDELFERAQNRFRPDASANHSRAGGKARYLLSGLLVCSQCESHYVLVNGVDYGCSSFHFGRACKNSVRVRRDTAEEILVGGLRRDLLSDASIKVIERDMLSAFQQRRATLAREATERPQALLELDARLQRLRERMKKGDPDMAPDEIQLTIERVEGKRAELEAHTNSDDGPRVLAMLPKAAERARTEITKALGGDSRASLRARVFLKDVFGGKIALKANGPELWASWNLAPAALLRAVGTAGSGGRI